MNKQTLNPIETLQLTASRVERGNVQTIDFAQAIGGAALRLSQENTSPSGYLSPEGFRFKAFAEIQSFVDNQQLLDAARSNGAARNVRELYLRPVIEFNHTVRGLIESHPRSSATEVSHFLRQLYQPLAGSSPHEITYFSQEVRNIINGMQEEIATEQQIAYLGYEYRHATIDEEIKGIDIWVDVDQNGTLIPFDDKRSPKKVATLLGTYTPGQSIPINSGFSHAELGDTLRQPYETVALKAPAFDTALKHGAQLYLQHTKVA